MQNQLININPNMTMSSLEISNLLEKRHDVVKLSIDRLVENKIIPQPSLVDGEKSANGTTPKLYMVDDTSGSQVQVLPLRNPNMRQLRHEVSNSGLTRRINQSRTLQKRKSKCKIN